MASKQIRAIREQLRNIELRRGLPSQAEIGHLLSLTRQLMEANRCSSAYRHLKLYCDWSVHLNISQSSTGRTVLLQIATLLKKSRETETPEIADAIHGVSGVLNLEKLRHEWETLYEEHHIQCELLKGDTWSICCAHVIEIIADKRIEFPDNPTGKWKNAYDEIVRLADGDDRWVIHSMCIHRNLGEEQCKFYKVPKGTYVWELKTTADIAMCSVLYYTRPQAAASDQ